MLAGMKPRTRRGGAAPPVQRRHESVRVRLPAPRPLQRKKEADRRRTQERGKQYVQQAFSSFVSNVLGAGA